MEPDSICSIQNNLFIIFISFIPASSGQGFTSNQHSADTESNIELAGSEIGLASSYEVATTAMVAPPEYEAKSNDCFHFQTPIKKPCTRQGELLLRYFPKDSKAFW
jgi:hypothetical protein